MRRRARGGIGVYLMLLLLVCAMLVQLSACSLPFGGGGNGSSHSGATCMSGLSQSDSQALMRQVAKKEGQTLYAKYGLPDRNFAVAEIFGLRKSGKRGTAYVYLNVGEFVALKGKAHNMSGYAAEAVIRFDYGDQGPKLSDVELASDGDLHDAWIKKNFPRACRVKRDVFASVFSSRLEARLSEEAAKQMGIPVEPKNLLNIDEKKGTYKIVKMVNDRKAAGGSRFVTIDEGKLNDLKRGR